jgi:hypothetical protein
MIVQQDPEHIEANNTGLFLASDDASYANGQAIPVDGDLTASMPHAGKRFRYHSSWPGLTRPSIFFARLS